MSAAQPPAQPPNNNGGNPEKAPETAPGAPNADDASMDTAPDQPPEETWEDIPEDVMSLTTEEVMTRVRLLDNDIKVSKFSITYFVWTRCNAGLGDAFGDAPSTTRAERHEREDPRQQREDQAE